MEHVALEIALITIIGIVLISKAIQNLFKIPLPHSFILLSFGIHYFYPELLNIHADSNYDQIVLFLIPLILMIDAIHMKWKYVKEYYPSMIYLAVFSVTLSIIIGTSLYFFEILGPGMTIGMYVALFSILMATDAISVSNIFSQFNIPHNVKVLTEGESLGNDATAMIAFFFIGLPWIINGSFDLTTIPVIAFKVFAVSTLIGLIVGYIGYIIIKMFHEEKEETLITIGVAYAAFVFAELVHVAGIFAIIVAVIFFKKLIDKELINEAKEFNSEINEKNKFLKKLKIMRNAATTQTKHENTIMNIENFAYIGVVLVFVSVADMINIEKITKYWKEILTMFLITTIIRAVVMAKFVFVGKKVKAIDYVGFNGWVILTLAGIKGAISILMVHALPKDFKFLEMFETITIGVILLSTFIYGFMLLFYMLHQEKKEATA